MDQSKLRAELEAKAEKAKAELMGALDALDGTKGDGFNPEAVRSRITAEIGRAEKRVAANPLKGIGIAIGCTAVLAWFLTRTFGC